jgi:tetratricopeptide (TPR) repeat protein
MTNLCRSGGLLVVSMFFLILPSCGQIIKEPAPLAPAESTAQSEEPPQASSQTPVQSNQTQPAPDLPPVQTQQAQSEPVQPPVQTKQPPRSSVQAPILAKQHMESGDYQKAIDDYRTEYRKHPKDQSLVKGYVKSIEDIKEVADRAFNQEDFLSAGKIYNILLRSYRYFNGFSKLLSFDRSYLTSKLSICKAFFSEKGFQEYRKGNLREAIELWKGYLAIDPNNAAIRKTLQTATLQQKNLEQKK